mmetsp:Transcript_3254/g.9080  ORF Transcript_3254/g.9080 Transcript_3254/m.9080 type:complete len:201 (+) Transcript_3254:188-790(+)
MTASSRSRSSGEATPGTGSTETCLPFIDLTAKPITAPEALPRSAPLCTACSVCRYLRRSTSRPGTCDGENFGSLRMALSKLASRSRVMPDACSVFQYALMSRFCCSIAISAWQMTTSSGDVLLCSFWCHSSIMPPLHWLLDCTARISSRTRCPTSELPPRPAASIAGTTMWRSSGMDSNARPRDTLRRSCAELISRGFTL